MRRSDLSPSRAVKSSGHLGRSRHADLKFWDFVYALFLHLLVVAAIAIAAFWQQRHHHEPLKRIEVMMISANELSKLEQQAHHRQHPPKHRVKRQHAKQPRKQTPKPPQTKPIKQTAPRQQAKPVAKLLPKASKPTPPISKPKAAKKPAEPFDPFAPLTSPTDTKVTKKRAQTSHPALADLAGKQLTSSEKERYIAMMQAAVQSKWKVPVSSAQISDPLVKMVLQPSGEVASVEIIESSGNPTLDDSLIRAIYAAAPFQLPRQQFEFFRENMIRFHPIR